jgi:hypothetical protein
VLSTANSAQSSFTGAFMKRSFFLILCFSACFFCGALPSGYGSLKLGMSIDEVKTELKKNPDFGYRGDRDVTLSPKTKQVIIETDAVKASYSFFTRCWFQFVDDKLFSITLNLNEKRLDHNSVFSTLTSKYGNPSSINPKRSSWEDDSVIMSLERPLTIKYIDAAVFKKIQDESGVKKTYEEKAVDEFLESL